MADNSVQTSWIVLLFCNLLWMFRGRADVAVHANMFWYVEEGDDKNRQAPDVLLTFGRPPRLRTSYFQWLEDDVPVSVSFEILSRSNDDTEMMKKLEWYEAHGVLEYYQYDPKKDTLAIYSRERTALKQVRVFPTWVSERLGLRFTHTSDGLTIERVDGLPFLPFEELGELWKAEKQRADNEKQRADKAEKLVDAEKQRARQIRDLSRKARSGQATPEELALLERLEEELNGIGS